MSRPTVLLYCQHLLGIGHLSRSLAICRALLERFDVVFLQGGPDIGRTIDAPGFTHVFLPPLLMREHDSSLYDPSEEVEVDIVWDRRRTALGPILARPYAAVIVELFPFGRNKFKPEILEIIERSRITNPGVRVYCSNRDIMVQKPDQAHREAKIAKILAAHFDHVLVHSDPDLIPMEATFGATEAISGQILYTGYVADGTPPASPRRAPREKRILVSLGGGVVGAELAVACAHVAGAFPDHDMEILTGPYTSKEDLEAISTAAAGRVRLRGFSDDFRGDLSRAAISISLAGYNTLMDVLATETPALVYPYMANREQNMRAGALAERGFLGVLYEADLVQSKLTNAIRERLGAAYPETRIDLSGAQTTAEILFSHTR